MVAIVVEVVNAKLRFGFIPTRITSRLVVIVAFWALAPQTQVVRARMSRIKSKWYCRGNLLADGKPRSVGENSASRFAHLPIAFGTVIHRRPGRRPSAQFPARISARQSWYQDRHQSRASNTPVTLIRPVKEVDNDH